jgi:acetyl-CoA/propionyl-CoA carboxylase, biotin carboxylase, biotin carboxyl carrier protein
VMAAWAVAAEATGSDDSPFGRSDGWRLSGPAAAVSVELLAGDDEGMGSRVVEIASHNGRARLGDRELSVVDAGSALPRLLLDIDGTRVVGHALVDRHRVHLAHRGQTWEFTRPDAFQGGTHARASDGTVTAPMPGTMLLVNVAPGQPVVAGDVLGVLEAMKMELSLAAPFDGTVTEVHASPGAQTDLGATLFVIEPREPQP